MWPFTPQRETHALVKQILRQVEKSLWDFQQQGADLSKIRLKKYQKTHYAGCLCQKCHKATKTGDARQRGMLEDGYKLYLPCNDNTEE